ncbi:MAG: SDR family NAD(P)-dependent oxidoreductase [Proteobacteria bacterium]|nr:SDR family NAD(P)-dependent oxidoreductase [Pseudomonadota bacterium]
MTDPSPNRFRAALITGASSGIGAAFAALLPAPTTLVLTGRDRAALEQLRDGLAAPERVDLVVADLAQPADRARLIEAAEARNIDLLVNNAGLGAFGLVIENDPRREAEMAEVNVVAPVVLTRALLPGMLARARAEGRRGGVIVVSSVVGFGPVPRFATYAATKAFDLHYAEALATELADSPIDVLALCPGATKTAFGARAGTPVGPASLAHSAERVAREGLAALGRRPVHVVGGANLATALSLRLLPRPLIRRGVAAVNARLARRPKRE